MAQKISVQLKTIPASFVATHNPHIIIQPKTTLVLFNLLFQLLQIPGINALKPHLFPSLNPSFHVLLLSSNATCNTAVFVLTSFLRVSWVFFISIHLSLVFLSLYHERLTKEPCIVSIKTHTTERI